MQEAPSTDPDQLLLPRETAKILRICERTLFSISSPRGPLKCVRFGPKMVRYRRQEVRDYVASIVS
jgi:hypothetical protein